jgi:hypothetical protein
MLIVKNRFRWLVVVTVVVAVAVIAAYLILGRSASEIKERAEFLAVLLGLFATLTAAVRWAWAHRHPAVPETSTPARLSDAVNLLAKRTFATWSDELVQRGIQNPSPVRVRWRWAGDDIALPRPDVVASASLPTDPEPLPDSKFDGGGTDQVLNSGWSADYMMSCMPGCGTVGWY